MGILEFLRHKLRIADGFIHVTPYLCGWEVSLTPKALAHTRTFRPFDQQHHIARVSIQSLLCAHGISGIPHGEVRDIEEV